jgi:hypothetical protein
MWFLYWIALGFGPEENCDRKNGHEQIKFDRLCSTQATMGAHRGLPT